MAKINLKLYDIDGCLYHAYKRHSDKTSHGWLIPENESFFAAQIEEINKEQYDKVVVAYGTNRQDAITNFSNSARGGSFTPALPVIQNYLASQLDCEVVLDPFLMADLYGDREAGESYKNILKNEYTKQKGEKHAEWVFDHSKVSLIYAHAWRVRQLHPTDEIVIDFYDDTEGILNGLQEFFQDHPDWLPQNIILRISRYKGNSIERIGPDIKGTSEIDERYDWSVRYLAASYDYRKKSPITTAEDLQKYKQQYNENQDDSKPTIHLSNRWNAFDAFNKFRETELPKLRTNATITQTANYTTAQKLLKDKLIPKSFVKYKPKKKTINTQPNNIEKKKSWSSFFRKKNEGMFSIMQASPFLANTEATPEVGKKIPSVLEIQKVEDNDVEVNELKEIDSISNSEFKAAITAAKKIQKIEKIDELIANINIKPISNLSVSVKLPYTHLLSEIVGSIIKHLKENSTGRNTETWRYSLTVFGCTIHIKNSDLARQRTRIATQLQAQLEEQLNEFKPYADDSRVNAQVMNDFRSQVLHLLEQAQLANTAAYELLGQSRDGKGSFAKILEDSISDIQCLTQRFAPR